MGIGMWYFGSLAMYGVQIRSVPVSMIRSNVTRAARLISRPFAYISCHDHLV